MLYGDKSGEALSKCPNSISTASANKPKQLLKSVRVDETAEWLYFILEELKFIKVLL